MIPMENQDKEVEKKYNVEFTKKELNALLRALTYCYAAESEDYEKPEDLANTSIFDSIIGKIVYSDRVSMHKEYSNIRNKRWKHECKELTSPLFMGAGYHSILYLNEIHKQINQASSILSGMQQNGGQGTEFDYKSQEQDEKAIMQIARNILVALGVKDKFHEINSIEA